MSSFSTTTLTLPQAQLLIYKIVIAYIKASMYICYAKTSCSSYGSTQSLQLCMPINGHSRNAAPSISRNISIGAWFIVSARYVAKLKRVINNTCTPATPGMRATHSTHSATTHALHVKLRPCACIFHVHNWHDISFKACTFPTSAMQPLLVFQQVLVCWLYVLPVATAEHEVGI